MQEPSSTPYQLLGGDRVVRDLVTRFYFYMDTLPQAQAIRKMHAPDLENAREKLYQYLSGWLGGPNLYIERYGHPRLRMRHLPFAIGVEERDQWLLCMRQALADTVADEALRLGLYDALADLATHMINRPPAA